MPPSAVAGGSKLANEGPQHVKSIQRNGRKPQGAISVSIPSKPRNIHILTKNKEINSGMVFLVSPTEFFNAVDVTSGRSIC